MDMQTDMQHQVMGYDRTATMFSPDGHLLQVEYAEKSVRLGSASIGIVCSDGVVALADRRVKDKLIIESSANKIYEIDRHIVAAAAGILSDARVLMEKAQVTAQQHRITYDTDVDVEAIAKEIANTKQLFTQYGGARPFGAAVMVLGVSKGNKKLYVSDVTGNYFSYKAVAIGENDEKINEILREEYNEKMNMEEGIKFLLKIFKRILSKNFDAARFDAARISVKDKKLERLNGEELKKYSR